MVKFYTRPTVKFKHITPGAEELIEWAGRQSTGTTNNQGACGAFVRRRVKDKHFSLGRFAIVMFELKCSRACSHQLVRHKHIDWCQLSQRYAEQKPEFMLPHVFKVEAMSDKQLELEGFLREGMFRSYQAYQALIAGGLSKEDARYVLPSACMTSLSMVMNFQAARDFISLRCDKHAQWEIRMIAKEIGEILLKKALSFFEDLKKFL